MYICIYIYVYIYIYINLNISKEEGLSFGEKNEKYWTQALTWSFVSFFHELLLSLPYSFSF